MINLEILVRTALEKQLDLAMINLEILVGTALEKQLDLAIDLLRDSGRDRPREAIGPGYD